MSLEDYDIQVYTPERMPQVLDVVAGLWAGPRETREAYFRWKYVDNPYTENATGIVALYRGKVVGFRGYFAMRYEISDKASDLIVLCAGDTCVHPDHRREGLSVRMGNLAMDAFTGTHRIFLNMTATASSLPGYLKMGFRPLVRRTYLSHYRLAGFFRYLAAYNRGPGTERGRVAFGIFDPMEIADRAKPENMAAVCAKQKSRDRRIRLSKDATFFRWRFENPTKKYVFYYHYQGDEMTGYVVLGLSPNCRRGYVLDYADSDWKTALDILRFIIEQDSFDIVSVYPFCLSEDFREHLLGVGFKKNGFLRRVEQKRTGELSVLIRPVTKRYTEEDWLVEGIDIRRIENWEVTEISSDAA